MKDSQPTALHSPPLFLRDGKVVHGVVKNVETILPMLKADVLAYGFKKIVCHVQVLSRKVTKNSYVCHLKL